MPFNYFELAFILAYVSSLLLVGWLGMRARKEKSMSDFYLAGRGIGFVVLLLTLYATQYSGNTLFGYTGRTYRVGFTWFVSVQFMTAIVICYLLFAPALHRLSKDNHFVTPTDFLNHRYRSAHLNLVATAIMVFALANFLLAQLKALGEAFSGFVPDHPTTVYICGVIVLALIIVIYESLGGFRAVAWTDVIQGAVLMTGFVILIWMVFDQFGSLQSATEKLIEKSPEKVRPPDGDQAREWISWIFLLGVGAALYPQAIQRIYAARDTRTLRRSLAVMAFLPLTTTLIALMFGIIAAANVELQPGQRSDSVLTIVCGQIRAQSVFGRWLVVVLFAGILAALMSTADSVLLSISSMLSKDIYARFINPEASEARLTIVGKVSSWILIAGMTGLAILLIKTNLVTLLKIKFEILIQLGPAFIIGLHWQRVSARPLLAGLYVGVAVAMTVAFFAGGKVFGFHAGTCGLAVNVLVVVGCTAFTNPLHTTAKGAARM